MPLRTTLRHDTWERLLGWLVIHPCRHPVAPNPNMASVLAPHRGRCFLTLPVRSLMLSFRLPASDKSKCGGR